MQQITSCNNFGIASKLWLGLLMISVIILKNHFLTQRGLESARPSRPFITISSSSLLDPLQTYSFLPYAIEFKNTFFISTVTPYSCLHLSINSFILSSPSSFTLTKIESVNPNTISKLNGC